VVRGYERGFKLYFMYRYGALGEDAVRGGGRGYVSIYGIRRSVECGRAFTHL